MTQPEALRLADLLCKDGHECCDFQAAAELRRLHAALVESEKWRDRDEARAANAERERDIAEAQRDALLEALKYAEAALSDIGDADREPGDDVAWCEARAAKAIPQARAAIAAAGGKKT